MNISLFIFILICFSAAFLGALATRTSVKTWYLTLKKPAWNPPSWIFGPVWSALYLMMAVAAWIIWSDPIAGGFSFAIFLFGIQLLLNTAWSFLFFGLRNPKWAMLDILILWIFIALTTFKFYIINSTAGLLFVPYLLWVSFAVCLNAMIVKFNKS